MNLSQWLGDLDAGPFRFGERSEPLEVTIVHEVVEPGGDGPRPTGERTFRRFVDGELVEEKLLPKQEAEET